MLPVHVSLLVIALEGKLRVTGGDCVTLNEDDPVRVRDASLDPVEVLDCVASHVLVTDLVSVLEAVSVRESDTVREALRQSVEVCDTV